MSFPRYPKYKESGVEWLGDVPEDWEVVRLKRAARVLPSNVDKKSYDEEAPVRLCNYTDVYYNDTISPAIDFMPATASSDQIAKFTLRAGDTVITKDSETAGDIAVAAYVPADLPGVVCGYHLSIVRPADGYSGAFIKRLFDSAYVKASVAVLANGLTRVGLGQHELENIELPFPPHAEQCQLARFLDRETAKIDALVDEQHRLIELLREKRQAIISHAVTKGLHPDVPMKSSGIGWLGDVPAHWEVKQLRQTVETLMDFRGRTPAKLGMDWGGDIPAISAVNVRDGYLDLSRGMNYGSLELHDRWMTQGRTRRGDVLFTTEAPLGNVALVPDNCRYILSQRVVMLRPQAAQLMPEYLYRLLVSSVFRQGIETMATGSTAEGVKRRYLVAMPICIPSLEEQRGIALWLDRETSSIDALVVEADRAIALLQERRAALISAAVTGKIDVRHLADAEAA